MAEICIARTKSGNQCRAAAIVGSTFCAFHADPGRAAQLGRRGGRKNRHYVDAADVAVTPPATPEDVKNLLAQSMADVHTGKLHPRIAQTLTYMAGTLLKAMEGTDLQHRVARLEEELQKRDNKC